MKSFTINNHIILRAFVLCFLVLSLLSFYVSEWQPIKIDQAAAQLIKMNESILDNHSYEFDVTYSSFKSHSGKTPYQMLWGNVIKDKEKFYSNINGAITIQNTKLRIIVDSAKKRIKVTNPISEHPSELKLEAYITSLNNCKSILHYQNENEIAFKLDAKASKGVVSQEIFVKNEFLSKCITYYVNEYNVRKDNEIIKEIVTPRLEVNILNYKKLDKVSEDIFKTESYLRFDGNKIVLTEKYKSFKLLDGRYKK